MPNSLPASRVPWRNRRRLKTPDGIVHEAPEHLWGTYPSETVCGLRERIHTPWEIYAMGAKPVTCIWCIFDRKIVDESV